MAARRGRPGTWRCVPCSVAAAVLATLRAQSVIKHPCINLLRDLLS